MRLSYLLLVAHLGALVAAGGRRAAMERMWLWYAYQIDLLNPEADRIVGYRCTRWDKANGCIGEWLPCRGSQTAAGRQSRLLYIQRANEHHVTRQLWTERNGTAR